MSGWRIRRATCAAMAANTMPRAMSRSRVASCIMRGSAFPARHSDASEERGDRALHLRAMAPIGKVRAVGHDVEEGPRDGLDEPPRHLHVGEMVPGARDDLHR